MSFERPVLSKQDALDNEFLQPTDDGVISHANVVSYQTTIDELLQTARYCTKKSEELDDDQPNNMFEKIKQAI